MMRRDRIKFEVEISVKEPFLCCNYQFLHVFQYAIHNFLRQRSAEVTKAVGERVFYHKAGKLCMRFDTGHAIRRGYIRCGKPDQRVRCRCVQSAERFLVQLRVRDLLFESPFLFSLGLSGLSFADTQPIVTPMQ